MMKYGLKHTFLLLFAVLAGCAPTVEAPSAMTITLIADGLSQTYAQRDPITVGEFLEKLQFELGELDRVNPEQFTQLSDGMRITVRRVQEEEFCETRALPYQRRTVPNEGVPVGEERIFQPGTNGQEQVCYRVVIQDGVRGERVQSGQATVLVAPQDEIVYVGPTTSLDPVDFSGTIAYINSGNVWVMKGNSQTRRPLTTGGDIDPLRAFSLSDDGNRLLYTRRPPEVSGFANEIWFINDTNQFEPRPVQLRPTNVLYAEWVPGRNNVIAYSRAEPRETSPGYSAYNDLWLITIDPQTGTEIDINPIIEESSGSGGPYPWWGRQYAWSADGQQLAWIHADAVGLVDLNTGELRPPLVSYEVFNPRADWSWRTSVSWSPDNQRLVTTVHGPPIGREAPDRSPVFNVSMVAVNGAFQVDWIEQAGIWSIPRFSPFIEQANGFPKGYVAYMQARQPLDSISDLAEYDLIVADRDGSNARRVFPPQGQQGIRSRDYAWSPDGTQIVLVYQGNLWLVDVETSAARQLTSDGNATRPVWKR